MKTFRLFISLIIITCLIQQNSAQLTKKQVAKCLQQNCPIFERTCPLGDKFCDQEFQKWKELTTTNKDSKCYQYQQQYQTLTDDQEVSSTIKNQWDACFDEWLSLKIDTSNFFEEKVFGCYNGCISEGSVKHQQYTQKQTYEQCLKENCATLQSACDSDPTCKKFKDEQNACLNDQEHIQFKFGLASYNQLKGNEEYPDYLNTFELACGNQESQTNDPFMKFNTCRNQCKNFIVTQAFTRHQYDQCINQYAPNCPQWDTQCNQNITIFQDKFQKNCETCQFEENSIKQSDNSQFLPSSCHLCIKKTYSVDLPDVPNFNKFLILNYLPIVVQCSDTGNIDDLSQYQQVNSSKEYYEQCKSKCQTCKTQECTDSQQKFDTCTQSQNNQCSKAQAKYESLAFISTLPLEFPICLDSCRPNDNSEFDGIFQCQKNCYSDNRIFLTKQNVFQCFNENCPIFQRHCPLGDTLCEQEFQKWKDLTTKQSDSKCYQYQQQFDSLKSEQQVQQIQSLWDECFVEWITNKAESSSFFEDKIFNCQSLCIKDGKIEHQSYTIKSTFEQCQKENCATFQTKCDSDENCKKYQNDQIACLSDKNNEQFNVAIDFYNLLSGNEKYPDYINTFELACGNEESKKNDPFTQLSTCRNNCKKNFDTVSFSRQQYNQCVDQFAPDCPSWDEQCAQDIKIFPERLQKNCDLCYFEENSIKKSDNSQMLPRQCSLCISNAYSVDVSVDSKFSKFLISNYIPIISSCSKAGNINDVEKYKSVSSTKEQYELCKAKCQTCKTQICTNSKQKFDACTSTQNSQCSRAQDKFHSTWDSAVIPVEYSICQDTCRPNDDPEFDSIFQCQKSCETSGSSDQPQVASFKYNQLDECKNNNVIQCSEWDLDCQNQKLILETRLKNYEQTFCKQCQDDIALLNKTNVLNDFFLPVSCQRCYMFQLQTLSTDNFSPLISDIYIKAYISCVESGNVDSQQIKSNATKAQFLQCIQDADKCDSQDQGCSNEETKWNDCKMKSQQCINANKILSFTEDSNDYPFAMIACYESCRTTANPKFTSIQDQYRQCRFTKNQNPDIDTQQFTYEEYQQCKKKYLPICASWDDKCISDQSELQKRFADESSDYCIQCKNEKNKLLYEKEDETYLMPTSCVKCYLSHVVPRKDDDFGQLTRDFYIPIYKDCAQSAKILAQQRIYSATVQQYKDCQEFVQNCGTDKDCLDAYAIFTECIYSPEQQQCSFAQDEFKFADPNSTYPYSLLVCKESCKVNTNQKFKEIQQRWESCENYNPTPEPDPIDSLDFNYQTYEKCKDQLPACLNQDKQCLDDQVTIAKRIGSSTSENCKLCQKQKDILEFQGKVTYLMPKSCSLCILENLQPKDGDNFQSITNDFYIPIYKDCASIGNIDSQKRKYNVTKIQYQQCEKNIAQCDSSDTSCLNAKSQFENCVQSQSAPCNLAKKQVNDASDNDLYPFLMLVCQQSCKVLDSDQFNKIQKQYEQCFSYSDTNPDTVEVLNFTYQDFQSCKQNNLPSCAFWDTLCLTQVGVLETRIKQIDEIMCYNCWQQIRILNTSNVTGNQFKMPKSCSQCTLQNLVVSQQEVYISLILEFFIPIYKDCALTGTIDSQQRKIKVTKKQYVDCEQKAPNCLKHDDCLNAFSLYGDCLQQSTQCNAAESQFNKALDTDLYPYSSLVCKESCRVKANPQFINIQDQWRQCEGYEKPPPPEYLDFPYTQYENCQKLNVITCAPWDDWCQDSLKYIQNRKTDLDNPMDMINCKKCDQEIIEDYTSPLFKMPKSCSLCQLQINQLKKGEAYPNIVSQFYISAARQCAFSGSIQGLQNNYMKKNVTKSEYSAAIKDIPQCSNDEWDCIEALKKEEECINSSDQCQLAQKQYTALKDTDYYLFSMLACQQSCIYTPYSKNGTYNKILTFRANILQYLPPLEPLRTPDHQNFTFDEYKKCVNEQVMQCPDYNPDCIEAVSKIKQREVENCEQCEKDKQIFIENQQRGEYVNYYPKSCTQCVLKSLSTQQNEKFNHLLSNIYTPAKRDCAMFGNVNAQENKIKINQKDYIDCKDKCRQCGKIPGCIEREKNYRACIDNTTNSMCNAALNTFGLLNSEDKVNYNYFACKESCWISGDDIFDNRQTCDHNCLYKHAVDVMDFTYSQYQQCQRQYVPDCADNHKDCIESLEEINNRQNTNDRDCLQCLMELEDMEDSSDGPDIKMPLSCTICLTDVFTPLSNDTFPGIVSNVIMPTQVSCAKYANINELQNKINLTKDQFNQCNKTCPVCLNDKFCINSMNKFYQCIQESEKCKKVEDNYQNLNDSSQYPYQRLGCIESCKYIASVLFNEIVKCWEKCENYTPKDEKIFPELQLFTYSEYKVCVAQNVIQCQKNDTQCQHEVDILEKRKNTQSEECQNDIEADQHLASQRNTDTYFQPVSCTKDILEGLQVGHNETFSDLINSFYLPASRDCAVEANVLGQERIINATKEQYIQCTSECGTCQQNDTICLQQETKKNKCLQDPDNKQCAYSLQEFNNQNSSDKVAYKYFACQQSCQNNQSENYNKIQRCQFNCALHGQDVQHDQYFNHTTQNFSMCTKKYVAQCPSWDNDCIYAKKIYDACYNNQGGKNMNCTYCQYYQTQDPRHPYSCLLCAQQCIDSFRNTDSVVFKELVMTSTLDCHQYARPIRLEDKYSIEVQIHEATNCYGKLCRDKQNCVHRKQKQQCQNDMSLYYNCKEDSSQCRLSELEWELSPKNSLVPLSKIICEHSCQSNKAFGSDIGIIFECQQYCYTQKTIPDEPVNPVNPVDPVKPDEPKEEKKDKASNIRLVFQGVLVITLMLIFI